MCALVTGVQTCALPICKAHGGIMGIEATGLGDIFTTPELSSETASRAAGQDFSSFLKALGVFPQPHVGEPTAAVGKPTPEAESGDPIPATPALDESDGEPPIDRKSTRLNSSH